MAGISVLRRGFRCVFEQATNPVPSPKTEFRVDLSAGSGRIAFAGNPSHFIEPLGDGSCTRERADTTGACERLAQATEVLVPVIGLPALCSSTLSIPEPAALRNFLMDTIRRSGHDRAANLPGIEGVGMRLHVCRCALRHKNDITGARAVATRWSV